MIRHNTLQKFTKTAVIYWLACFSIFALAEEHSTNSLNVEPASHQPAATTLLVLGDSLSAAYGLPEDKGWVALAEKRLLKHPQKVRVINASISGATTANGLQRLPSLLTKYRPAIVILELGANDGLQGKPLPYIEKNLTRLTQQSLATGAQVILVGNRLPPNLGKRYTEPFFQLYITLARSLDTDLVPFMLDGVAGVEGMLQADGLHPTAQGQLGVLKNMWPAITRVLKALPRQKQSNKSNKPDLIAP